MSLFKKETQLFSRSKYFIKVVLRNSKPDKKCFNICFPLHIYLKTYNIHTTIVPGNIENIGHFILKYDDKTDVYIDPTIRQFKKYKEKPKVFIGWTLDYDSFKSLSENDFKNIYCEWLYPILNNGWSVPYPYENHKQYQIEIKSQIEIQKRAAQLISKRRKSIPKMIENCKIFESYCIALENIIDKNTIGN